MRPLPDTFAIREVGFDAHVAPLVTAYGDELVQRKPTDAQRDRIAEWGDHHDVAFLVCFDGPVPVGCVALQHVDQTTGEVMRMFVQPTHRGRGVGRALLAAVEELAVRRGMRRLRLDTMTELYEALAMYRSSGYGDVEPYNDNPVADHWLAKDL